MQTLNKNVEIFTNLGEATNAFTQQRYADLLYSKQYKSWYVDRNKELLKEWPNLYMLIETKGILPTACGKNKPTPIQPDIPKRHQMQESTDGTAVITIELTGDLNLLRLNKSKLSDEIGKAMMTETLIRASYLKSAVLKNFEIPLKSYVYGLNGTSGMWSNFDGGRVNAENKEHAMELAIEQLKYDFEKVNSVLAHADITVDFNVEFDEDSVYVREEK